MGPEWVDRPWWGTFGWLAPLLLVAGLTGLVVWIVMRTSTRPAVAGMPSGGPAPTAMQADAAPAAALVTTIPAPAGTVPGVGSDVALEAVRLRYARGEMTRDEFLQVSRDLGAPATTLEATEGGEADA
jgi:hypothetical protein